MPTCDPLCVNARPCRKVVLVARRPVPSESRSVIGRSAGCAGQQFGHVAGVELAKFRLAELGHRRLEFG